MPSSRRRAFRLLLATLALLLLAAAGLWRLSGARSFQLAGELLWRAEVGEKLVALTFDDGPVPEATRALLDLLADRGVRATFFLIGQELATRPQLGRELVAAGHELGNHSWSHRRMLLRSPGFIATEIEQTDALIRAAGQLGPIHFRPPYGKRLLLLPLYLARHGRLTVMWDVEPESDPAVDGDTEAIVAHVLERVRPGSIVLLHPMYRSRGASLRAVPGIVDGLQARGYRFVTVTELRAAQQAGSGR